MTDAEIALCKEREAAKHGCCCKCCSVTAEIWACFLIDLTSVIGLLVEIPHWSAVPASLHAVDMFWGFLVYSSISACLILFALRAGKQEAWPRRALVRFMSLKLPIFVVFCIGYFTVSPWAAPLAQWVCSHDFEHMLSVTGGDYETCVQMFPWLCTLNNAIYIPAYMRCLLLEPLPTPSTAASSTICHALPGLHAGTRTHSRRPTSGSAVTPPTTTRASGAPEQHRRARVTTTPTCEPQEASPVVLWTLELARATCGPQRARACGPTATRIE